ncbi:tRNA 2-selenouridine(34) synthase MnmH [Celeribacter sp.]|uniref:tRNA 2-selenouridine(34) synthase MnmH n=1 Tax=Celeribacter sp. TaxID=1890673 RepID=UPI003A92F1BD
MTTVFPTLSDFLDARYDTIIDVRSPSEFAEDHIPGAVNLPVFSDRERAQVGTIYVQQSPFLARKIGAAILARNAAAHIEGPLADKEGAWRPLVYCWRGGQRSNAFAIILRQIGWRVDVVEGGYKSWRRAVVKRLYDTPLPHRFVLIDGNTGAAKTDLIARVREQGGQVLDLEALANHRGSIFGALGRQPAQKGFESALAVALERLDPEKPTLVEAESSRIGNCTLPPSLWAVMCAAPRFDVTAPLSSRARYLAEAYADVVADAHLLERLLGELVPFHGYDKVDTWKALAREGNFVDLAGGLMAEHYDPRYAKSRKRHETQARIATIDLCDLGEAARDDAATRIIALMESL